VAKFSKRFYFIRSQNYPIIMFLMFSLKTILLFLVLIVVVQSQNCGRFTCSSSQICCRTSTTNICCAKSGSCCGKGCCAQNTRCCPLAKFPLCCPYSMTCCGSTCCSSNQRCEGQIRCVNRD
jgi:hypothetical protein